MDSEDFFSTISQFLVQFRKLAAERLSRTPKSRLGVLKCWEFVLLYVICLHSRPASRDGTPDIHTQKEPSTSSPILVRGMYYVNARPVCCYRQHDAGVLYVVCLIAVVLYFNCYSKQLCEDVHVCLQGNSLTMCPSLSLALTLSPRMM